MKIQERWCNDYAGYCPFTSEPIGKDKVTSKPIFQGDCVWITSNLSDENFQSCTQLENELRMSWGREGVMEGS